MKVIIWGTGKLYQKYKDFLLQFNIIKLCDNNPDKQGKFIDGIEIIGPTRLMEFDYDYIVIMTYASESIYATLNELEIPHKKVILYSQIYLLKDTRIYVNHDSEKVLLNDWIKKNQKCILLISHNYSYTGIPVALKNMAVVLKKIGYSVLMAAMEGGTFTQELTMQGIDYITDLAMWYQTQIFMEMLESCKAVILGSFSLYRLADSLDNLQTQIFWWIHETDEKYYVGKKHLPGKNKIIFLSGGNRVKKVFLNHYKDVNISKLQYCIPDFQKETASDLSNQNENGSMTIAVVGTVDKRKAQDILLEAVLGLPVRYKDKLKVIMIGRLDKSDLSYVAKINGQREQLHNLEWVSEMTQRELDKFYESIDVLVCPSRDDPMPIVVTQAMMHRKICIISKEVGQAEFIVQQKNGFVFPSEDVQELMKILMWLLDHKNEHIQIGELSRIIYKEEFSEEVMEQRLKVMMDTKNSIKDV